MRILLGEQIRSPWDCGAQFTSSLWAALCNLLNVQQAQTTAYHLQYNGLVERFHRRLRACCAVDYCTDHLPWVLLGQWLFIRIRFGLDFIQDGGKRTKGQPSPRSNTNSQLQTASRPTYLFIGPSLPLNMEFLFFPRSGLHGSRGKKLQFQNLKGLSYEIDFENVDENWQIFALTRAAAGFWIFQRHLWFLIEIKHLLSGKC